MPLAKIAAALALIALPLPTVAAAPDIPLDTAKIDKMDAAAMADPAAYIDVLVNCAAYHGVVAVKKGNAGISSKGHDDMAIMLLSAATLIPPQDSVAVNNAYMDKLFAFMEDLDGDAGGSVEKDLVTLGETCKPVEGYAEATILKAQADGTLPPATEPVEKVDPEDMFDALFAEGTDMASAYRGLFLDCAAYQGTRRDPAKDSDLTGKSEELIFLAAAVLAAPGAADEVESDHDANLLRFSDSMANDTTGEIAREFALMKDSCASLLPIAEQRIEAAKSNAD